MLLLLFWAALFAWRYSIDRRERAKRTVRPEEVQAWTRVRTRLVKWTVAVAGVAAVVFVSWQGAQSDIDAAGVVAHYCERRLDGAPLQACFAAPHEVMLDRFGDASRLEALLWVLGAL